MSEEQQKDTLNIDSLPSKDNEEVQLTPEEQQALDVANGKEPEKLAGKYASREELDKGINSLIEKLYTEDTDREKLYKYLEGQIGGKENSKETNTSSNDTSTPSDTSSQSSEEQKENLSLKINDKPEENTSSPFNFQEAVSEYLKDGKLSEETSKKTETLGIPLDSIKAAAEAHTASEQLRMNTALELAGGRENFQQMQRWASSNMSAEEKTVFNTAMDSKDINQINMAVLALKAKYEMKEGTLPKSPITGGKTVPGASTGAFDNNRELVEAMRDPRYSTDSAYRNAIYKRLEASNL